MAAQRVRSPLAPLLALAAVAFLACRLPTAFLPTPAAARALQVESIGQGVMAAALAAAAAVPEPVFALQNQDDDEGFDMRIIATFALPLVAISWALFNVWRVAFRQVSRFSETASGSSKDGLRAED
ncbi:unnamed protein product [Polarella glacialis]|uniref:Photosystem II protein Y n=1 Tax=Polarella glacialis TaxID=89957 RepID=A0A813E3Q0_POLGL|nr:unnamed protein product [Polarella glacialis]CAE8688783.1 unnamed protein product [Polarella glacialis]|mmetsp:Transcript_30651/g.49174  ORF Transcript_30651/g.49174 Transcript_30651/m.49174 type:complete len:126 (+) Transcript_30651:91-468(+)|eukprot:CAMPEP_0115083616 /NCGR_PEP_ID=MMETSP0227-20121206/20680_1 /TAXON_ID=89957 /ORGANISM="Polarella glacialis, Strain CCMP 1383" /LENGTH=125 /DNA_ID=CAMNT_0002472085 /DNA_START=63 /DNA_END=440 /DNA_ORIENTATION=-